MHNIISFHIIVSKLRSDTSYEITIIQHITARDHKDVQKCNDLNCYERIIVSIWYHKKYLKLGQNSTGENDAFAPLCRRYRYKAYAVSEFCNNIADCTLNIQHYLFCTQLLVHNVSVTWQKVMHIYIPQSTEYTAYTPVSFSLFFEAEPFAAILIAHRTIARNLSSGNCDIWGRRPRAGKRFLEIRQQARGSVGAL